LLALQQEGSLIEYAGKAGKDVAGGHARAMIDGLANGLLRLEGAEACAPYFFALSDRVCGGVKALTVLPVPAAEPAAIDPAAIGASALIGEAAERDAKDAAPGEPTEEAGAPAAAPPASPRSWRPVLAILFIVLSIALVWRAGFEAGRFW